LIEVFYYLQLFQKINAWCLHLFFVPHTIIFLKNTVYSLVKVFEFCKVYKRNIISQQLNIQTRV